MPEISRFYGIIVAMFYEDHSPPHFHARYGGHKVMITIETMEILEGNFPRRALGLLLEWASLHRDELRQEWRLAMEKNALYPIAPLE